MIKVCFLDVTRREKLDFEKINLVEGIELTNNTKDADVISVVWTTLNILKCNRLKYILNRSMAKHHIPETKQSFIGRPKIKVKHIDDYCSEAIRDYVFDKIGEDRTSISIVGTGRIGKKVIEQAKKIFSKVYIIHHNSSINDIKEAFSNSKFITFHLPLTKESKYWFNKEKINFCFGVNIINTSADMIINIYDIIEGINKGNISMVYLDTVENKSTIRGFSKIKYTNHKAWMSEKSIKKRKELTIKMLEEIRDELSINSK